MGRDRAYCAFYGAFTFEALHRYRYLIYIGGLGDGLMTWDTSMSILATAGVL